MTSEGRGLSPGFATIRTADIDAEQMEHHAGCWDYQHGVPCARCEHKACGWCPECHPEVPEW